MEKVVINPKDVRGLGDIVSPKQSSDFLRYGCIVTDSADSTLGTVYSTTVKSTGSVLSLTYPRYTEVGVTSFTVEALLKNSSNSAITSATVHLLVNDVHMTATTNSSGKASFTIPVGSNPPLSYRLQCYYIGSSSVNGCFASATVVTIDDVGEADLDLFVEKPVIQTGEHDNLIARLHDGSRGVPGQTVYFYEEYEPTTLLLGSDKSIIQTGEQANLRATLKDEDGSGIQGQTVYFYSDKPWDYFNTGNTTDGFYTIPTSTLSVVDEGLKITTTANYERKVYLDIDINTSDNWIFEWEVAKIGVVQSVAAYLGTITSASIGYFNYTDSTGKWSGSIDYVDIDEDIGALSVGDVMRMEYVGGVLKVTCNNNVLYSEEVTFSDSFFIGFYTNSGREQYIKNIGFIKW